MLFDYLGAALEHHRGSYVVALITFLLLSFVLWNVKSFYTHYRVPGPRVAAWSNIPRMLWVLGNEAHHDHIKLHRKYGKMVRFGPNMISVSEPSEMHKIYGFGKEFQKSDFYHVLLFYAQGKPVPTIFATQDKALHRSLKKPIASLYTMHSVVSFEPHVDSTINYLFERLDTLFVELKVPCDLGKWLQFFAFDVIGEITFSQRIGFLEKGDDIDGIIASIWRYFVKASPASVTQIPWVDKLWTKNPILNRFRKVHINPIVAFGVSRVQQRKAARSTDPTGLDRHPGEDRRDFLSQFLEIVGKDPSVPPFAITPWVTSNVTAGSDTTAILLRTLFYNLLIHPDSMKRLKAELSEAARNGRLSRIATWREASELPYLDACIKEAGRIHPPFGLPLERVVPEGGVTLCDRYVPPGTVVAMSAWVIHRHEVFGDDVDEWRPERWLCEERKRREMERALLTFGAGHRSCLGKNISYLEIYKLVPSLLQVYRIDLLPPTERPRWRVENRWFVNQFGLEVCLQREESIVATGR